MAIEAPPALPDGKPSKFVQRLKKIVCDQMQTSADPAARQKFSNLLICLNNPSADLPESALTGKADHPTCTSILYAKVLQAVALIRVNTVAKELESVVAEAERLVGKDYRIVGDHGIGWRADFGPAQVQE